MPDNRKPLIYGAFPVCRNYTVRAHIRNVGAPKRRGRENRIEYARSFRRGIHAKNLHPRHTADAGKRSRKDGQFHGTGHVKKQRAAERIRQTSSPTLSGHFAVWVTVWVRRLPHILIRTYKCVFPTKKHRKPRFSMLFGAAGRIRTADLILTKDALYRLSYSSIWRPRWGSNPRPPA